MDRSNLWYPRFAAAMMASGSAGQMRGFGLALIGEMTVDIAVGMGIAGHPPHRSERAQFRHSAPTSSA